MLKSQWKFVALACVTVSAIASADHWVSPNEVARLAKQVDNRAQRFCEVGATKQGLNHFIQDALQMGLAADQFRGKVERGAPYPQVLGEYQQLQASYQHMDENFKKSHHHNQPWEVRYLWLRLSYAFHQLDWAMTQGEGALTITIPDRPDTPDHGGHGPGGNPNPGGPGPRPRP